MMQIAESHHYYYLLKKLHFLMGQPTGRGRIWSSSEPGGHMMTSGTADRTDTALTEVALLTGSCLPKDVFDSLLEYFNAQSYHGK